MSNPPAPSGQAPKPGKYVKVSLFLKKQPHVTDDHFHAYWAHNHLNPAFANKTFMDKVRRYNQVCEDGLHPSRCECLSDIQHHITPEWREMAKSLGAPVMDYDGIAEVWVDSFEDWKEIVSDPEFVKQVAGEFGNHRSLSLDVILTKVLADEPNFILAPIHIMVGYDHLVLGDDWTPKCAGN